MIPTNAATGEVLLPVTTPVTEDPHTKDEVFLRLLYVCVVFICLSILFWFGDILYQQYVSYSTNVRFLVFETCENNGPRGSTAQCAHNNTDSTVVVMSPPPYSSLDEQDTNSDPPPTYQEKAATSLIGVTVVTKNKNLLKNKINIRSAEELARKRTYAHFSESYIHE
ncbi:hypothetical protein C0Q70_13220 [Pomacea canaliculata]|uniref:Uncharacterized protein n=1 Tax=Pomacea canaliculata TaxID=400727 RepID=A0A2T7NWM1_POMCA|nr:hypothetical protein C0Q70_13220 [Pomacea canaliculata]